MKKLIQSLLILLPFLGTGTATAATPPATPTPTPDPLVGKYQQAFTNWGKGTAPPIATMSSQLIQAGQNLPHKNLPAAMSLRETGGLSNSDTARRINNPFGIGPGIQYPNLETSILGGSGQRGFKGVMEGPNYQKYRETGSLNDFLNVYSPPGKGNPTLQKQLDDLTYLLSLFE